MTANVVNILMSGVFHAAILFLVAAGLQVVFGVQKIFNLACGSFYALGAYVGVSAVTAFIAAGGTARPLPRAARWRRASPSDSWAWWSSAGCCASCTSATRPSSSC